MAKRLRVGVLFGGRSGEHDVSLMSARTVLAALEQAGIETVPIGITPQGHWITQGDPLAQLNGAKQRVGASDYKNGSQRPIQHSLLNGTAQSPIPNPQSLDLIFPVLHGPYGEDGTVQGLLEMANLPYVGCGVLASSAGMDKALSKQLFAAAGLPQTPFRAFLRRRWQTEPEAILDELEAALTYPLFVKPANLGSSVGISKAKERGGLAQAIDLAASYDRRLVVEQGVAQAREIEVSILGNDDPQASVPGEVVPSNEFYDYEAKYLDDRSQLIVPADLPESIVADVQRLGIEAFRVLDCSGLARVDFLLGADGRLFLNEVNTMPGFTHASMYPRLWQASGLSLPDLVQRLVELAMARYQDRQQNRTDRGSAL